MPGSKLIVLIGLALLAAGVLTIVVIAIMGLMDSVIAYTDYSVTH